MRNVILVNLFSILFFASAIKAEIILKAPTTTVGLDAIYGLDDREIINNKSDKKVLELSESIALIVSEDHINLRRYKSYVLASTVKDTLNMCTTERFLLKPAIPGCTGFLVAPNILATAGHCFQNEDDCANKKIIFGVDASRQRKRGYIVSTKNVFSCIKIISSGFDPYGGSFIDYALIELDRVAENRAPLKLNLKEKIADSEKIFMIGHPFGMPQILSANAVVTANTNEFQFTANLDSFEGNSGSPVFNAHTFDVEGILVNGREDLVQDSENECYRNIVYGDSGSEGVLRASELAPFLK